MMIEGFSHFHAVVCTLSSFDKACDDPCLTADSMQVQRSAVFKSPQRLGNGYRRSKEAQRKAAQQGWSALGRPAASSLHIQKVGG